LRNGTGNCNRLLRHAAARGFTRRGWTPRPHQLELLTKARASRPTLLIAPTGCDKTLSGFLPTLVELHESAGRKRLELFADVVLRLNFTTHMLGENRRYAFAAKRCVRD
jgi:Lhr-like helicase